VGWPHVIVTNSALFNPAQVPHGCLVHTLQ